MFMMDQQEREWQAVEVFQYTDASVHQYWYADAKIYARHDAEADFADSAYDLEEELNYPIDYECRLEDDLNYYRDTRGVEEAQHASYARRLGFEGNTGLTIRDIAATMEMSEALAKRHSAIGSVVQ